MKAGVERPLRVGVVGANARRGWSRISHIPALQALPEYELAAVCTSSRESAAEAASAFGAERAYADYRSLVEDASLDVISVSVGVPQHREVVLAALGAGKHVYCEWPLGVSSAEADEMASFARSTGLRSLVGLQARADPTVLTMRELIGDGYVGDVLSCSVTIFLAGLLQRGATKAWMADDAAGANAFTILGGHALDVICFCIAEFADVSARLETQAPVWETGPGSSIPVTAPDNLVLHGLLDNGALVSLHAAMVPWHASGWKMEVYGREGTLVASAPQMVEYGDIGLIGARGHDPELQPIEIPSRLTLIPANVERDERFNVAQMYRLLSRAIESGHDAEPDFEVALRRHHLLDMIRDAADVLPVRTAVAPLGLSTGG